MQLSWNHTEYISSGKSWDKLVFKFRGSGINFWLGARFTPMEDVEVKVDVPNQLDFEKPRRGIEKFGVYLENTVKTWLKDPIPMSWTIAAGLSLLWNQCGLL